MWAQEDVAVSSYSTVLTCTLSYPAAYMRNMGLLTPLPGKGKQSSIYTEYYSESEVYCKFIALVTSLSFVHVYICYFF